MIPVRYCLNGHWDDPGLPVYIGHRTWTAIQRDAARLTHRFETVRFCLTCGSELIMSCPECDTPLQHGPDRDAPQHCGGCGRPLPWTRQAVPLVSEITDDAEEVEAVPEPRVITAPVGRVKGFKIWAGKAWVKISPAAGKVISKVATDYIEKLLIGH